MSIIRWLYCVSIVVYGPNKVHLRLRLDYASAAAHAVPLYVPIDHVDYTTVRLSEVTYPGNSLEMKLPSRFIDQPDSSRHKSMATPGGCRRQE
jgi:hypothetical protein